MGNFHFPSAGIRFELCALPVRQSPTFTGEDWGKYRGSGPYTLPDRTAKSVGELDLSVSLL